MNNFSENLKYYRELKGYSQEKLAEIADISKDSIQSIESKNVKPRLDTFVKICNALNIPADFLLKDDLLISKIYTVDLMRKEYSQFSFEQLDFYEKMLRCIIENKNNKIKDEQQK